MQALSQEASLLKESKRHLSELTDEAARMKPALSALEGLYASLAAADTQRASDLAQQESEHRSARHQHYLGLQLEMDRQYEELQRNSVHARAAHAERSFQQDLETYRQRKSQADTTAYQQPSHRTQSGLARQQVAAGSSKDSNSDVSSTSGDTHSSRKTDGVVSAHGAKASATMAPTTPSTVSQQSPRPPASPGLLPSATTGHSSDSEDSDAASAVVILQDEDFL
ncbi:hypothetical protein GGI11_006287 [Coemansia sp. RSA 2049]|nr:hypothetical protein GGI11_006287 [Coemansia sp. RSA 2049]